MKLIWKTTLLLLFSVSSLCQPLFVEDEIIPFGYEAIAATEFLPEQYQRDQYNLYRWLLNKRCMLLWEKSCALRLSGDMRFLWGHIIEHQDGHSLRERDAELDDGSRILDLLGNPFSSSVFAADLNLYLDFTCGRSWTIGWLQFKNVGGVKRLNKTCGEDCCGPFGSGTFDDRALRKAYFGYNICLDGTSRFDIEIGRRPLWTVFESRVEFQSNFDGVLLSYSTRDCCNFRDFYIYLGGFVVDAKSNHWAWITEVGVFDIFDLDLDVRYSYVDWKEVNVWGHLINRCGCDNPCGWNYRVSQISADYNFWAEVIDQPAKLYGAFLYNHAADRLLGEDPYNSATFHHTIATTDQLNKGFYLGFLIGKVCLEGDWSFDINYQYVEPLVIPDPDVGGIGRGNVLGASLTETDDFFFYRGNGNYKGWRVEGVYALTTNLTVDLILENSNQVIEDVGGRHKFSLVQLQGIYAF